MSKIYKNSQIWLTIDIEEIINTNFHINWRSNPEVNYEKAINNWINLCSQLNCKSTCFVLGSFAKAHPNLIKKLSENGHEIASHGMDHRLVNKIDIVQWQESIENSKKILEDVSGSRVIGYRAASWSMPFEKQYYEILARNGYEFSSSYFPMKTYMYGNSIDRKDPFIINTDFGEIKEIPVPKFIIPFSGGFYLRTLPLVLQKYLFKKLRNGNHKPVIYIHPYELFNKNMLLDYYKSTSLNIDYFLAFFSSSNPVEKIKSICKE